MSIAEQFEIIADAVYDKGRTDEWSDFWDDIQDDGNRPNYEYAFFRWGAEYIRPKYKVSPNQRIAYMFARCSKLKKVEKEYFDLSNYTPVINATSIDCNYQLFYLCSELEEIEDIGIQGGGYYQTYNRCSKLHTIEKMRCVANGVYSAVFTNCSALENITIEGEIGKDFNISSSPLLTQDSINSIIDHLVDLTGQTAQKLTFHSTIVTNLTEEQFNKITNKNWSVD